MASDRSLSVTIRDKVSAPTMVDRRLGQRLPCGTRVLPNFLIDPFVWRRDLAVLCVSEAWILFLRDLRTHGVRRLVRAGSRGGTAVARRRVREHVDHLGLRASARALRGPPHGERVERTLHVVVGGERRFINPKDAEAALVRHTPAARENELGVILVSVHFVAPRRTPA